MKFRSLQKSKVQLQIWVFPQGLYVRSRVWSNRDTKLHTQGLCACGKQGCSSFKCCSPEFSHILYQQQDYKKRNYLPHMALPNSSSPLKLFKVPQDKRLSERKSKLDSLLVQYCLFWMTVTDTWCSLTLTFSFCGLQYIKSLPHSMQKSKGSYTVVDLAHARAKPGGMTCVLEHFCAHSSVLPRVVECNMFPFAHTLSLEKLGSDWCEQNFSQLLTNQSSHLCFFSLGDLISVWITDLTRLEKIFKIIKSKLTCNTFCDKEGFDLCWK